MSGGRSLIQAVRSMTYLLVRCYQLTLELDGEFPPLLTVPYAVKSANRRAGSNCYAHVLKPSARTASLTLCVSRSEVAGPEVWYLKQ